MESIVIAELGLPQHAAATIALLDEYARHAMGGGAPLPAHVRTRLVPELLKRPAAHVVLAFIDDQPAGLAICFESFSTFACRPLLNIHDIVVTADQRGRGLSRRLLARVETLARELDCCKLTLEVLEGNHTARAAYLARGFAGYTLDPAMGQALFWQKSLA